MEQVRRDSDVSEHSVVSEPENVEDDITASKPKRVKVDWQETLVNIVATQQQQIAELTRQSKMATCLTPTPSSAGAEVTNTQASVSGFAQTSFKLTSFDPDKSAYSIDEWLDDATKLKEELNVSDNLMIAKASEALKNRAYRYCCDWRPLCRSWVNFCADLGMAFPDKETPGARAYKAATLRSHDFDSLCEYGNQKLISISRFHDKLPWEKILSMVEYKLDHAEARSAVQIQKPASERELLKLLSEFDARRADTARSSSSTVSKYKSDRRTKEANKIFKGSCFKCGRQGHQKDTCRSFSTKEVIEKNTQEKIDHPISCGHCKKIGHSESTCWFKHGKPKKAFVLKK